MAEIAGKPWLYVGTGRLLGEPDLTDTSAQSMYGFTDPSALANASFPTGHALRDKLRPLAISPKTAAGAMPNAGTSRTIACSGSTSECASKFGWVVDMPDDGERINVEPVLTHGTLAFLSNVPRSTACSIGGYSWFNYLDFKTGLAVAGSPSGNVSTYLGDKLSVGTNLVHLITDGTSEPWFHITGAPGDIEKFRLPFSIPEPVGRRVSWREIIQ